MQMLEELVFPNNQTTQIIKGKRTKRQRHLPSPITKSKTTVELRDRTEEEEVEEDIANCLIFLAQGNHHHNSKKSSLYLNYQCKTCNRCFPSFQALGGHRTSHKKPKANGNHGEEEKQGVITSSLDELEDHHHHETATSTILSLQIPNRASTKDKVHECCICGAEFSSGQALGGHMRRHRGSSESQEAKKSRSVLKLDLNLPAPEEDHREPEFSFRPREKVIVFSGSSLVDCHY